LLNLIGNGTSGGAKTVAFNGDDGIEVFGPSSEGKKFIGGMSITTSADGLRSFTFSPATSVAVGQEITATATSTTTGDTSECSALKRVASS
jgi:hypothetical protein